jgi:hypothetical protein
VSDLRIVGEFTTPGGPAFDYFYVFIVGKPPRMYQVPMEAVEPIGVAQFFNDLGRALAGTMHPRLANSTDFASNVLWPREKAGEALFEFSREARPGFFGNILSRIVPRTGLQIVSGISDFCGGSVEWAA